MGESGNERNVFHTFGKPESRGILVPGDREDRLVLTRHALPDDLSEIVERLWIVRWDLEGLPPREQVVLPFPCVNVAFGHAPGVHGPVSSRFQTRISGKGRTVGLKFKAGGFHPLLRAGLEPSELVDRQFSVGEVFAAADAVQKLDGVLTTESDPNVMVARAAEFLRAHHPGADADDQELNRIVARCQDDGSILRVAQLADGAARSVRALERLFRSRIGISPKWVIRRYRVQEAALRLASGVEVDLSALAQSLGYFDQSHFIHDFRSQVGKTPKQYLAFCASVKGGDHTRATARMSP